MCVCIVTMVHIQQCDSGMQRCLISNTFFIELIRTITLNQICILVGVGTLLDPLIMNRSTN